MKTSKTAFLFSLAVFCFLSSCSASRAAGRVISPTLINGRIPPAGDYQAVFFTGGCTATVVGDRVVLMAGHCAATSMSFSINRDSHSADCMVAQEYFDGQISEDRALCYMASPVSGIPFENVNVDENLVKVGDMVLLTGFGCTKDGRPLDGKFRIGEAKVVEIGTNSMGPGYIVTKKTAALCPGDSGGPVFALNADGSRGPVIAVNSRSNLVDTSFVSSLSTKAGKRFISAWKKRYPLARICGIDADAKGCLNAMPVAPASAFELDHDVAVLKVQMKPEFEKMTEDFRKYLAHSLTMFRNLLSE